jgi:RNA-directed DNA polymerase
MAVTKGMENISTKQKRIAEMAKKFQTLTTLSHHIYEEEFLPCSFGFRRNKNAHQCIEALRDATRKIAGGWVVELDIRKFFDTIPRQRLVEILKSRVRDGVILRLVGKWLHAGVMEEGVVTRPKAGTPQGGVISPLLANVFLHEVLDVWFEREVRPRMKGQAHLFRYADDAVMLFENGEDAERVFEVLPKRFEKFGLALHPEKTRLLYFKRPDRSTHYVGDGPGTFDFLGFTHHWGKIRSGHWVVFRRTMKSRMNRALKAVWAWLKANRHKPLAEQRLGLAQRLRGHYSYYAIAGNKNQAWRFLRAVEKFWKRWLETRSHKAKMGWAKFFELLKCHPLPKPNAHNRSE